MGNGTSSERKPLFPPYPPRQGLHRKSHPGILDKAVLHEPLIEVKKFPGIRLHCLFRDTPTPKAATTAGVPGSLCVGGRSAKVIPFFSATI